VTAQPVGRFDFAVDLPFGQEAEDYVRSLLRGVLTPKESTLTVEVKRDAQACHTGNVYLEYAQLPKGREPWVRSGLELTDAVYFAVVMGNVVVFAPTVAWRHVSSLHGVKRSTKGDNPTVGRVVRVEQLLQALVEAPWD
jgi:hypothetical protein